MPQKTFADTLNFDERNSRNLIEYICAAILMVYSTVLPQIVAWVFISNKKRFTLATIQYQHLLRFQWKQLSLPDHFSR